MRARRHRHGWGTLFAATIGIAWSLLELSAQAPPERPAAPKASIILKDRHGHATPWKTHDAHTGGGNTEVAQLREDVLVIAMSGVVTAGPHPCKPTSAVIDFDLNQEFEIAFADPKLKGARLAIEAQIVGLLRGDKYGGSASVGNGAVVIACGNHRVLALPMEAHAVGYNDYLAINDHKGPINVPVLPGEYRLLQKFQINATHDWSIRGRAAAAEFAPDPALDPTWISITDPFHGVNKKEFGFRVTLRIEPE